MDRKKTLTILKSVAIILIIVCFAFLLRMQSTDLSVIPTDSQALYKDSSGLPYFTEMDSYYNLRLTQDYIDHGYTGDLLSANGTPWDMHSYAPDGRSALYTPLIIYATSFLHYLANLFSEMSLKEVAFYAAAIIAPLAAIPAYIIVRRVTNDYGGITAGLLIALAPNYFSHTVAGFFDTDMFTVILPLFMFLFFIESIRSSKFVYRIIFSLLTVATIVIFSLAWSGYIFYVAVLIAFMVVYLFAGFLLKMDMIKPRKNYSNLFDWFVNQKEIFSIVFIAVVAIIGLGLTNGFRSLIDAPASLLGLTQIQSAADAASYPNVLTSVAEMQIPALLYGGIAGAFSASPGGIVNGVGGIVALFGAFIILFALAQRLWTLSSYKRGRNSGKKPPKGERKSTSRIKEIKERESFIESTMGNVNTIEDINKSKRQTLLYLTLFSVWIVAAAMAVTQGSRFIQVLMIPLSLCVGLFVGYAVVYIKKNVEKKWKLFTLGVISSFLIIYPVLQTLLVFAPLYHISQSMAIIISLIILLVLVGVSYIAIYGANFSKQYPNFKKTLLMVIVMLAIVTPTVFGAYQMSESAVPSTSDPMWNSMTWVKANTTNDTTMVSWWDFGYLFEIAADRPTVFDGGSQTGIRAFWVGKAMTTNDSDLSAGIFEMLSTSGDNASELLDKYTHDSGESSEILVKTLALSREEAKTIMTSEYKLTNTQATNVLKLSHPEKPKPTVFVASSDMLDKAGVWTHFGNWDFDENNGTIYSYYAAQQPAKLVKINDDVSKAIINNGQEANIFFNTVVKKGVGNNTTNATTETVYANGRKVIDQNNTTYNPFKVNRLIIIEDGILMKNQTVNSSANFTLLVMGINGTYTSFIISKELENSIFTKLFILQGYGQDRYELIHSDQGISLWKIKDAGTTSNSAT